MRVRLRLAVVLPLVLLTVMPRLADGQQPSDAGAIKGVACDSYGGVLAGVTVSVTVGGLELKAVTDAEGRYTLSSVPAGAQTVRAVLSGFREAEKQANVGPRAEVDLPFVLCPAALVEIDWIAAPSDLSVFSSAVDVVAYVRVTSNDARSAECEFSAAKVTTAVVALLKSPTPDARTITFWQELWSEERTPYAVGSEMIVFLTRQKNQNRFVRSHGPMSVFPVSNGVVIDSKFLMPSHRRYIGRPVDELLRDLRKSATSGTGEISLNEAAADRSISAAWSAHPR